MAKESKRLRIIKRLGATCAIVTVAVIALVPATAQASTTSAPIKTIVSGTISPAQMTALVTSLPVHAGLWDRAIAANGDTAYVMDLVKDSATTAYSQFWRISLTPAGVESSRLLALAASSSDASGALVTITKTSDGTSVDDCTNCARQISSSCAECGVTLAAGLASAAVACAVSPPPTEPACFIAGGGAAALGAGICAAFNCDDVVMNPPSCSVAVTNTPFGTDEKYWTGESVTTVSCTRAGDGSSMDTLNLSNNITFASKPITASGGCHDCDTWRAGWDYKLSRGQCVNGSTGSYTGSWTDRLTGEIHSYGGSGSDPARVCGTAEDTAGVGFLGDPASPIGDAPTEPTTSTVLDLETTAGDTVVAVLNDSNIVSETFPISDASEIELLSQELVQVLIDVRNALFGP